MNNRAFNALRKIAADIDNAPAAQPLRDSILSYRSGVAHALPGYATGLRPGSVGAKMKRLIAPIVNNPVVLPFYLGAKYGKQLCRMLPNYDINAPKVMEAMHTNKAPAPGR